ncbi:hypothetical protein D3C79_745050 [compost metagenome]
MTDVRGISNQLQEDASDFLIVYQNIIRPFQSRAGNTKGLQRTHYRQANHKAQTFQLAHAAFNT